MNEESTAEPGYQDGLRFIAESRIKSGTVPPAKHAELGVEALAVLHRLASEADSAADGLKLLHELRTYQVELDLQYEQLLENEQEMAREVARYKALFEAAPAGYLVVDLHGQIVEGNQAAADLFGAPCTELQGALLQGFLPAASRPALVEMQKKLLVGEPVSSCIVSVGDDMEQPRRLRINARIAPNRDAVLMMMCECIGQSAD